MRNAAIVLAVAVAASAGLVPFLLPAAYRVERSIAVAAPPAEVLSQLGDLQRWPGWSPAEARDPRIARRYGGRVGAPGMTCYWSGNAGVGRGRMTLVAVAPDRIELEVETEEPWRGSADVTIRVVPDGGGSRVTWTVAGENGPVARVAWLLARRERALARSVEERLPLLRAATETAPRREVHRIEASARVAAAPAAIRAALLDLPGWSRWAPWAVPGETSPHAGGEAGAVGASLYWPADRGAGGRRVTLLSDSAGSVEVELAVGDEGAGGSNHDLAFRLAAAEGGTLVSWSVSGDGGVAERDLVLSLERLKALSEVSEVRRR